MAITVYTCLSRQYGYLQVHACVVRKHRISPCSELLPVERKYSSEKLYVRLGIKSACLRVFMQIIFIFTDNCSIGVSESNLIHRTAAVVEVEADQIGI